MSVLIKPDRWMAGLLVVLLGVVALIAGIRYCRPPPAEVERSLPCRVIMTTAEVGPPGSLCVCGDLLFTSVHAPMENCIWKGKTPVPLP